jgi:hypothetical protein
MRGGARDWEVLVNEGGGGSLQEVMRGRKGGMAG